MFVFGRLDEGVNYVVNEEVNYVIVSLGLEELPTCLTYQVVHLIQTRKNNQRQRQGLSRAMIEIRRPCGSFISLSMLIFLVKVECTSKSPRSKSAVIERAILF